MYKLAKAALFSMPPETSHHLAFKSLGAIANTPLMGCFSSSASLPSTFLGLDLPNPVGLAAGLDKNAEYLSSLSKLGFGFIEVGTITPKPQAGNPKPRLFRLPEANAIINRMGFNNAGIDQMLRNIDASQYDGILGINIGKNKVTEQDDAVKDYLHCLEQAYQHADYITVNLSSPNTPGLRDLQFGDAMVKLLSELKNKQQQLVGKHGRYVPLAVKIAPDMAPEDVETVTQNLLQADIDAVIATNTTIARDAVAGMKHGDEMGGLSGRPVRKASTSVIEQVKTIAGDQLPIIGVGGIDSGEAAVEKVIAGADVVQVYTGFIYQGPGLISDCVNAIAKHRA